MRDLDTKLVGVSSLIRKLRTEIPKIAKSQKHVLIRGEKGTGKTLLSQLIHETTNKDLSLTLVSPFGMTDAVLHGLDKGVGAKIRTLVFQDIEDFSFLHQTLICRIIDRLPKKPFVRVIATIKEKPEKIHKERKVVDELVKLFTRFEEITLSPLNARSEDIPPLVEYFVSNACQSVHLEVRAVDINTLDFLAKRNWEGNIEELRSVVERAILSSEGDSMKLPEYLVDEQAQVEGILANIKGKRKFAFDKTLANLEKTFLQKVLDVVNHNQTRAAEILNISEPNLRYRIRKFHLTPSRKKHL